MVVQLAIVSPAREVGEGRGDNACDVFRDDPVRPRTRAEHLAFRVVEDELDRFAVALLDDTSGLVVTESPHDRNRLGDRKREVETGNGGTTSRGSRPRSDWLAAHRIAARAEHVGEVRFAHLRAANDPATAVQIGQTLAQKDARRRARGGVVVRQSLRRFRVAVTCRDRVHKVAKATTKAHYY